MRDTTPGGRPSREIPRYGGALPEAQPQHHRPTYDPSQRPRRHVVLPALWWVWPSIGIGLAVVANALAGRE